MVLLGFCGSLLGVISWFCGVVSIDCGGCSDDVLLILFVMGGWIDDVLVNLFVFLVLGFGYGFFCWGFLCGVLFGYVFVLLVEDIELLFIWELVLEVMVDVDLLEDVDEIDDDEFDCGRVLWGMGMFIFLVFFELIVLRSWFLFIYFGWLRFGKLGGFVIVVMGMVWVMVGVVGG